MDVYTDYANWKFENYELINALITLKSKIISRFSHTILVVDYLYDKRCKDGKLDPDFEVIFETGFNYIHDHFMTIQTILKSEYRNNIQEMDKNAKTINLLLYTQDFENELMDKPNYKQEDYKKLSDFEDTVDGYIERHEEVPDELFAVLDDITIELFDSYNGINEIMYEVALDLDLIKGEGDAEDEFGYVDAVFGKMVDGTN